MFTESNTVEAYLSDLLADLGNPRASALGMHFP